MAFKIERIFELKSVYLEPMKWDQVLGQEQLKNQLQTAIEKGKVGHAHLFVGAYGYGLLPMALAFASALLTKENPEAYSRVESLNHLDLHFSFPVFTEDGKSLSSNKFQEFRSMVLENPYVDFADWSSRFEKSTSKNTSFFISTSEIQDQIEKFSLKSFEKGSRILIVWGADKIREEGSNKFLKFLEEPPANTYIFLLCESLDFMLRTILSRVQIHPLNRLSQNDLLQHLSTEKVKEEKVNPLVFQSQGNLRELQKLLEGELDNQEFEHMFAQWVRDAVQVMKKPQMLKNIILWARTVSSWKMDKQRQFLAFCIQTFRQALMQTYGREDLVYYPVNTVNWEKFVPFIHGANIEAILEQISLADSHIARNGNQELIWTDLGIKLSRYINRKPILRA